MPDLSPTYASPGLRWGLLLEDHASAYVTFGTAPGSDLGIPDKLGGDADFVIATIHFPDGSGRVPITGYKPIPNDPVPPSLPKGQTPHLSDLYNVLCTKALGRALKRAGYPDDTTDLRALVVWRQRDAEIDAIRAGTAGLAIAPAQVEKAIEQAGKASSEATSPDDTAAPNTDHDGPDDNDVVVLSDSADETLLPPADETVKRLRSTINKLGGRSSELTRWAKERGYRVTRPSTEQEALDMIGEADRMLATPPDDTGEEQPDETIADPVIEPDAGPQGETIVDDEPSEQDERAATVAELVEGLTKDEKKSFSAFCRSIEVDPAADWETVDKSILVEILGWFDS